MVSLVNRPLEECKNGKELHEEIEEGIEGEDERCLKRQAPDEFLEMEDEGYPKGRAPIVVDEAAC